MTDRPIAVVCSFVFLLCSFGCTPGPTERQAQNFITAPCYYHNYMLGELLASQLHHHIVHEVLGLKSDQDVSYVGDERLGRYLREKVFGPGALYPWNEMIERATGEPLTPKYFVRQFVQQPL